MNASAIERINPGTRYSDAVIHNNVTYCVEVPADGTVDIRTQTASVLEALERTLARCGSGKDKLIMATIYLTDMADLAGMNEVWDAWLPPGCAPQRACVSVSALADPAWRIEIAATAAV
jgi:enamine deaminase RidA (YjgF/YER057c/UK114 family)